jgi:hypothetical protein
MHFFYILVESLFSEQINLASMPSTDGISTFKYIDASMKSILKIFRKAIYITFWYYLYHSDTFMIDSLTPNKDICKDRVL